MHRVEIYLKSHLSDFRGLSLVRDIYDLGIMTVLNVRVLEIYGLNGSQIVNKLISELKGAWQKPLKW